MLTQPSAPRCARCASREFREYIWHDARDLPGFARIVRTCADCCAQETRIVSTRDAGYLLLARAIDAPARPLLPDCTDAGL